MSRKRLSLIIAGLITVFVVLFFLFLQNQRYTSLEKETFAMDSFVIERIYGGGAEEILEYSNELILNLDSLFDRYESDSEIYKLNNSKGEFVALSEETIEILQNSIEYSHQLNGRFDITIGPIIDIYNKAKEDDEAVDKEEIEEALYLVDITGLDMAEGGASLLEGMSVDLGGVAKGYLCDKLNSLYRENGVESAIVSVGGSILAIGKNPNGEPFKVGIRDPLKSSNEYLGVLELTDEIISTSGGYERFFESGGESYHHIIDPKTGYPSDSDLLSVAVIGENGLRCDIYSTYLFIVGSEELLNMIDDLSVSVIAVTDKNEVIVSAALKERFTLNDDSEYTIYER